MNRIKLALALCVVLLAAAADLLRIIFHMKVASMFCWLTVFCVFLPGCLQEFDPSADDLFTPIEAVASAPTEVDPPTPAPAPNFAASALERGAELDRQIAQISQLTAAPSSLAPLTLAQVEPAAEPSPVKLTALDPLADDEPPPPNREQDPNLFTGAIVWVMPKGPGCPRCIPCEMLVADLEYVSKRRGWTVGTDNTHDWWIRTAPHGVSVPRVTYYVDAKIIGRHTEGYRMLGCRSERIDNLLPIFKQHPFYPPSTAPAE